MIAAWRAIHMRHSGRPLEAARLHEQASDRAESAAQRVPDLVNASLASGETSCQEDREPVMLQGWKNSGGS